MRCPTCGVETGEGKRFCKTCGSPLVAQAQIRAGSPTVQSAPQTSTAITVCPQCGSTVTPGRPFCKSCGAALRNPQQSPPVSHRILKSVRPHVSARKPINWRRVGLVIGIPVLLAGMAVGVYRYWPRRLLTPVRLRTILDRATSGPFAVFNEGAPGRRVLVLSTRTDLWQIPSGKSLDPGINVGYLLSPDGETFLADDRLSLFNWATQKRLRLENPPPQWVSFTTGGGSPNSFTPVQFSNDGAFLAAARANGSLYLLSTATGRIVHTLREGSYQITHTGGMGTCTASSLAFSPNGTILASGELNGDITLWNTSTGDQVRVLRGESDQPCEGTVPQSFDDGDQLLALAFSPNGRLVASEDSYGVIRVWQVGSGKLQRVLPFSCLRSMQELKFSPDGRFLVSGESGYELSIHLVWDATSGHLLRALSLPGNGAFDFAQDGNLIVAQLQNGRVKVQEWALRSALRLPFVSSLADEAAQSNATVIRAYEDGAIQHLDSLVQSLGSCMGRNGGFPATLQAVSKCSGMPKDVFREELFGYRFLYAPGQADEQGHIASFVLSARPLLYKQTGTRSFRVDQTGQTYATAEDREATAADSPMNTLTSAIQVAGTTQNAARQQAASHLAHAQTLFQQSQFQAAVAECDAALSIDPSNQEAAKLKSQIERIMAVLGQSELPQDRSRPRQDGSVEARFSGTWVNGNSPAITRLEVQQSGNLVSVHAWGRCHPQDCDWGTSQGVINGDSANIVWDHGTIVEKMKLVPVSDRLHMVLDSSYRENRGEQHLEEDLVRAH